MGAISKDLTEFWGDIFGLREENIAFLPFIMKKFQTYRRVERIVWWTPIVCTFTLQLIFCCNCLITYLSICPYLYLPIILSQFLNEISKGVVDICILDSRHFTMHIINRFCTCYVPIFKVPFIHREMHTS